MFLDDGMKPVCDRKTGGRFSPLGGNHQTDRLPVGASAETRLCEIPETRDTLGAPPLVVCWRKLRELGLDRLNGQPVADDDGVAPLPLGLRLCIVVDDQLLDGRKRLGDLDLERRTVFVGRGSRISVPHPLRGYPRQRALRCCAFRAAVTHARGMTRFAEDKESALAAAASHRRPHHRRHEPRRATRATFPSCAFSPRARLEMAGRSKDAPEREYGAAIDAGRSMEYISRTDESVLTNVSRDAAARRNER